jgi:hypothetical protein
LFVQSGHDVWKDCYHQRAGQRCVCWYVHVCFELNLKKANTNPGTILWDGRFNEMSSSADLEKWSWGNQVGNYQYYIHGSGAVSKYVNLSPSFKNQGDTGSKQGAKITIDSTAKWNSVSKCGVHIM